MKLSVVSTIRGGFFFPDLLPGKDFRERMAALRRLGFDAVEIWGMGLKQHLGEVKAALAAEELPVSVICSGFRGNLLAGDVDERMTCFNDFKELLNLAGELEAGGLVFVPLFDKRPQVPDLSPYRTALEVERELFLDMLGQLTGVAEQAGTRLLLEPVNRYETHVVNRVEQAVEICREVGSEALRVIVDFYHMNMEEADIATTLEAYGDYVRHVHLTDSNRCLPGQGHTDFAPGLKALRDHGYEGYLSFECFARGDPQSALPEAVAAVKQITGDEA